MLPSIAAPARAWSPNPKRTFFSQAGLLTRTRNWTGLPTSAVFSGTL